MEHVLTHRVGLPPFAYDNLLEAGVPLEQTFTLKGSKRKVTLDRLVSDAEREPTIRKVADNTRVDMKAPLSILGCVEQAELFG